MQKSKLWPHNLYSALFGNEYALPENWEEAVDLAFSYLPERHREMMDKRYRYGLTLKAIGAEAGISREGARRIIAKSLNSLQKMEPALILLNGTREDLDIRTRQDNLERRLYLMQIAEKYGKESEQHKEAKSKYSPYRITDYSLSARTVNCLTQHGYEYLDELLPYEEDTLLQLRNFGVGSLNELKALLIRLGLLKESDLEPTFILNDGTTPQSEQHWPRNLIEKVFTSRELVGKTIEEINVEAAINTLPKKHRRVLYALYRENLPREEARRVTNIPEFEMGPYEKYAIKLLRHKDKRPIIFYGTQGKSLIHKV